MRIVSLIAVFWSSLSLCLCPSLQSVFLSGDSRFEVRGSQLCNYLTCVKQAVIHKAGSRNLQAVLQEGGR
jgi:hypothetical protein